MFAKNSLAKYPFLPEATEYIKRLDLKIEDLAGVEFEKILERAEERVEEAVLYALVSKRSRNEEIEITSFPVALILAIATANSFIKKRYALAEAKRVYEDLKEEPKERTLAIAKSFGWRLDANKTITLPHEFVVSFVDYLRNTCHLRDKKWKLVNRILSNGAIYLTRNETARLLSEEVRKHIERRLDAKDRHDFPQKVTDIAERIKKLSIEKIGKAEMENLPKTTVLQAFPPCMNALYHAFTSGRHLSHIGRFALTAFLINIGMCPEKVIELFKNFSDFDERLTRYQVEHIAGEKGSQTRYVPPMCDTLRTHGVCQDPDEICARIRHPLAYYRIKLK